MAVFSRIGSFFSAKPRAGDLVALRDGPDAGKTGTVTYARGRDVTVEFDGTERTVSAYSLRIVRRQPVPPMAPDTGVDLDYEEARARINQLPPPMT